MVSAKISAKGQITLPRSVRQALDVKPGERVLFVVNDHQVTLRSLGPGSVRDLAGSLGRYAKGRHTAAAIRHAVQQEVARAAAQEG